MSDNWICIIPKDPNVIPEIKIQKEAEKYFKSIVTQSDEIKTIVTDSIQFYDSGANFERIRCPFCQSEIEMDWWQEKMDNDSNGDGFKLNTFAMPCCNRTTNLNNLLYDFEQGFSKYCIEAMNPNIDELGSENIIKLKDILGIEIKVIYQHI